MAAFICPYCSVAIAVDDLTHTIKHVSFEQYNVYGKEFAPSCIEIEFFKCPNCGQYTINAVGVGSEIQDVNIHIRPVSTARQYPDYVPIAIRQDYEEAYAIINLSPKASATLARRCLQGMIRDFWGIDKNRLVDAIKELKDKVTVDQWEVMDKLRQLGNIGAHMENDINLIVDIDPDETQTLLSVIEFFIEQWYIERHNKDELFNSVLSIAEDKQNQRKKTE